MIESVYLADSRLGFGEAVKIEYDERLFLNWQIVVSYLDL